MENLNWGMPTAKKSKKEEKYDVPVVTLSSLEKKGAGRKFSFNKAAQKSLGIDNDTDQSALIGFNEDKDIFFKVEDGINEVGFKLTKSATFSNKKAFEYISEILDLDNSIENELFLSETEPNSGIYAISEVNIMNEETENVKEEIEELTSETSEPISIEENEEEVVKTEEKEETSNW